MRSILINESQLGVIRDCLLNESVNGSHVFYDYLESYGVGWVLNSFLDNHDGVEDWLPLIDSSMYYKALDEFSRYGKLIKFPSRYVYQWMGIIMRNTAKLYSNTLLAGHGEYFPIDECYDFLCDWFNDGRYISLVKSDEVVIELYSNDIVRICNGGKLNESSVSDVHGQYYFPFITNDEASVLSKRSDFERFCSVNSDIIEMVNKYNKKNVNGSDYIEVNYDLCKFLYHCDAYMLLDDIGLYDWMKLPDGSDGWSDFGLSPLFSIIDEYSDELEPEKVLVLVNRCLDVYHQRGDLSSIFISGGKLSLDRISGVL